MNIYIIDLPWPSRDLHPNARVHWARKAKAAKAARQDASLVAKGAGLHRAGATAVSLTAIFCPPDGRRRDIDGMLSSMKPSLDGLSDAIGVDDSEWAISLRREAPIPGGNVRIEIEVTT